MALFSDNGIADGFSTLDIAKGLIDGVTTDDGLFTACRAWHDARRATETNKATIASSARCSDRQLPERVTPR
jgi:hypothetical protein